MSNLRKRINKYLFEKVVDLTILGVFVSLLLTIGTNAFNYGNFPGFLVLALIIIIFIASMKVSTKVFTIWKTKELTKKEDTSFKYFDSFTTFIILSIIVFLLSLLVQDIMPFMILFMVVFALREWRKWGKRK